MASSPLTLAALATSAVPGLVVHGTRDHESDGDGAFSSAVLVCEEEELIVRVPRTQAAEVQQSAELLALSALTAGARARLPFAVSEPRGITRAGDTRAVVSTFLRGERISAEVIEPEALLIDSLAAALAAIHELPHTIAHHHGLTVRTAEDARLTAARLIERAEGTRLLPETVHTRWTETLRTAELWDFAPTFVHGSLGVEQFLVEDDAIIGVLDWSELSVGDPALDLAWLLGSGSEVLDQVLGRYIEIRGLADSAHLRTRIAFMHELEIVKWLLHGVEQHDAQIVDDAVAMMDGLVDRLSRRAASPPPSEALGSEEVSRILDEVPEVPSGLSDTAAYEALDEDRMFHVDTDFVDPLPEDAPEAPQSTEEVSERGATRGGQADPDEDTQVTEPVDPLDRETQSIDPDLLPPKHPE